MTICQNNNAGLNAFSPAKWQERRNNMKKQVIITNDGSLSLSKLVRDLEANGFEVKLVESDGIMLESIIEKSVPDIIIVDAFMKNRDALDVLASLGGKLKKCDAKFFVKAALKNKRFENKLLKNGADAYLVKPVTLESVIGKRVFVTKEGKGACCFRRRSLKV